MMPAGEPSALQIDRVDSEEGPLLLRLRGELDFESARALSRYLGNLEAGGTLVLGLRDLEFMDSSGLAAILAARQRAALAGGTLHLIEPTGNIRALLERTGLLAVLIGTR
jgi:anti-anti-sigma factor